MFKILGNILTLVGLILTVGKILVLAYVCSKYIGRSMVGYSSSPNMKVVDRIALGQDKSLVIAKVGAKYFLLGVSSASINMLKEISPEELGTLAQTENKEAVGVPQFKSVFSDLLSKMKR